MSTFAFDRPKPNLRPEAFGEQRRRAGCWNCKSRDIYISWYSDNGVSITGIDEDCQRCGFKFRVKFVSRHGLRARRRVA